MESPLMQKARPYPYHQTEPQVPYHYHSHLLAASNTLPLPNGVNYHPSRMTHGHLPPNSMGYPHSGYGMNHENELFYGSTPQSGCHNMNNHPSESHDHVNNSRLAPPHRPGMLPSDKSTPINQSLTYPLQQGPLNYDNLQNMANNANGFPTPSNTPNLPHSQASASRGSPNPTSSSSVAQPTTWSNLTSVSCLATNLPPTSRDGSNSSSDSRHSQSLANSKNCFDENLLNEPPPCAGCGFRIEDKIVLKVMERYWHASCLKCSSCQAILDNVGSSCFIRGNMILCRKDYTKMFGNRGICSGCEEEIPPDEMVMRCQSMVYHMACFHCAQCHNQLRTGDHYCLVNGKLFCEHDFDKIPQQPSHNASSQSSSSTQLMSSVPNSSISSCPTATTPSSSLSMTLNGTSTCAGNNSTHQRSTSITNGNSRNNKKVSSNLQ